MTDAGAAEAAQGLGDVPRKWTVRSGPQRRALRCHASLLLFGGAAGSLKSETLLVDAGLEYRNSALRAILLRRSYPELEKSLIRRSRELYSSMGGVYHEQRRKWTFPSGATIEFGYCEAEKDIYRYQGAEYSYIAFDESTHFSEFCIRYMLSRLRSVDSALRLRLRLASNPGNVGHNFHKALFQGKTCLHCRHPGDHPYHPGLVGEWPSDAREIRKTITFIPGNITDHSLLNRDYRATLDSLPGAVRRALLEGCWDVFEGQYFDNWRAEDMVIARPLIGEGENWPCWVGADYGFNGSQAAAYLFCKSPACARFPNGQIFVLEEYTARHQKAADFACELARRFARREEGGAGRKIQAWYLSPDAWSRRGDDRSLADQMIEASGLPFAPAATDRIGGAMLIYTQLDRGELKIADTCRELQEAIPTRIHDPGRPDDVLKIAGDPLDDCLDALRYGLYTFISPPRVSPLERECERFSPDATVAMVQYRQAQRHWTQHNAPSSYLPRRRA